MTTQKKVLGTHNAGSNHWVGDGFPVRNLFPSNGLESEVNPFLMLDYAGPLQFRSKVLGTHNAGSNHWVGDGFPVRNLFPSNGLESEVNPFLMLDYAGPLQF